MATDDYVVVLMRRGSDFSLTARRPSSRLDEMRNRAATEWDSWTVVKDGLCEEEAKELKGNLREEYTAKGYTYRSRPPLS